MPIVGSTGNIPITFLFTFKFIKIIIIAKNIFSVIHINYIKIESQFDDQKSA
jgi:hypothetical protein